LYTIHFQLAPGINPAAIYCLVQNKMQAAYDRMLNEVKRMIPLAAPERILLDFEIAATNAFRSAFPNATVTGCYFHLTQSVMLKVNKTGMKEDYEKNDRLRLAIHCLPALAMVPRTTNSFEGWHYGMQALFQCHRPTLWTFMKGLEKDMQMQLTAFLKGVSGLQPVAPKSYLTLKRRVENAVARYSFSEFWYTCVVLRFCRTNKTQVNLNCLIILLMFSD